MPNAKISVGQSFQHAWVFIPCHAQIPAGITHSANMADPEDWIDPLRGYTYDSYNADALLNLSKVKNRNIELPGGAKYQLLIVPGALKMSPDTGLLSLEIASRLRQFVNEGATVMLCEEFNRTTGLLNVKEKDKKLLQFL